MADRKPPKNLAQENELWYWLKWLAKQISNPFFFHCLFYFHKYRESKEKVCIQRGQNLKRSVTRKHKNIVVIFFFFTEWTPLISFQLKQRPRDSENGGHKAPELHTTDVCTEIHGNAVSRPWSLQFCTELWAMHKEDLR